MEIKKLIVGNTTEVLIRTLFDNRIAEESSSNDLSNVARAMQIRDLKNQILVYLRSNPNSRFTLVAPEFKSEKTVVLKFNNFIGEEDDEDSSYAINIEDNFVEAEIIKFVEVGQNLKLTLKAK
jgi:hypothetical protein